MNNLPALNRRFNITFPNGNVAKAVHVPRKGDLTGAIKALDIRIPVPVIFVSGGASNMSDKDRKMVLQMIAEVARFAQERKAIVVDGGTESGVMQMVGEVRRRLNYSFPLIGVSPAGKVAFPGFKNKDAEASLEDSHSHFILVEGSDWGHETHTIINLAQTLCGNNKAPSVGILINGGRIALHEIYLASTRQNKLSIIVLEGSGRAADEVSTAFREGRSNRAILQAILAGGDIQLVATSEGPEALRRKLQAKFDRN